MKKIITLTCLILSAVIILDSFNVWHVIIMFYFAGEIPGTRSSLSATTMLQLFSLLIGFVVARVGNHVITSLSTNASIKQNS